MQNNVDKVNDSIKVTQANLFAKRKIKEIGWNVIDEFCSKEQSIVLLWR